MKIRSMFLVSGFVFSMAGCGKVTEHAQPSPTMPEVTLVKAETRNILRTMGQPGFVEAYEQTSIFSKIPGYIETWNVDIGDKVKKNQLLATLFVPELLEEHGFKQATVALDKVLIDQAKRSVDSADGTLQAATAKVVKAKADVGKFEADVVRWQSEVKRLTDLVAQRVVDKQILDESTRQLRSAESARDASLASVIVADSERIACQANLAKAKVDVLAAEATVKVAEADEKRLAALVGYISIPSPYDGIVVLRNANTGDFVQAATGDQTARLNSPDQSSSRGAPIFAIARTDIVRIFVDVPEADANFVNIGTKAEVRVQAFNDMRIDAQVTRTSWALNVRSRTLRAEIDLINPDTKLLPGMYAYGYVKIERNNVMAIPTACITKRGDLTVAYTFKDGNSVELGLKLGASDGVWHEVLSVKNNDTWETLTGEELFLKGDLDELDNNAPVKVRKADNPEESKPRQAPAQEASKSK
ncbi:MAG: efflux RND transporter periplasmic adaptor subunit [Planctomycetales bacterium]|jgi:multidrug efflux pump subunit AcrA (membrane-fusion protein)|nr:efflux RND transporter periplasmic adaptor subunit [Planctomycetales bacterium]